MEPYLARLSASIVDRDYQRSVRCDAPGCYAYAGEHLGDLVTLRDLKDYQSQELVNGILALVRRYRPIHVSIVGGEPLVRWRELDCLLPKLAAMQLRRSW